MSEQVLFALMHLFAIIARHARKSYKVSPEVLKYVKSFLHQRLTEKDVENYYQLFIENVDKYRKQATATKSAAKKPYSAADSVKTLMLCRDISKTLSQSQRIIGLIRLFELVNSDRDFSIKRLEIIDTVANIFGVETDEYNALKIFVTADHQNLLNHNNILVFSAQNKSLGEKSHFIEHTHLEGMLFIIKFPSVQLYFSKYIGTGELLINGHKIYPKFIYPVAFGSFIKPASGHPIYYSDIVTHFFSGRKAAKITIHAQNIKYVFKDETIGIQELNISERQGKLVGILGASGAGKTTLFNILSGIQKPTQGQVIINGINIHETPDKLQGIIGYVSQDDLLIEELTVYQNLYYNAKLCLDNLDEFTLKKKILDLIDSLDLSDIKNLKVGNVMEKIISGGQRKRLNIGLELIREPSILFLDEPTSGLSSHDSEKVMRLLGQLSLKGQLIFTVIHQPSSDIFKMFDNVAVMDRGGHLIYYGNPIEAISYFKEIDHRLNSHIGECPSCGNVNPELIFNIIESQTIDEYGRNTGKRKISPKHWKKLFLEKIGKFEHKMQSERLPSLLNRPSILKQGILFFQRDAISKWKNNQYLVINSLEAPVLALVLSLIIKYSQNITTGYNFRENENIPAYFFMAVIVMLFIGLTVSAEEIFKDRKILKREAFLKLSRFSYLSSKALVLFLITAIQSFFFALIGNTILEINNMFLSSWLVLFSIGCCANIIGLNISSAFKSAVAIYILIPLLLIPQMILGGGMFSYEKINRLFGGGHQVPFIANTMPSRWGYEALVVDQFTTNSYESLFYEIDQKESLYHFKQGIYISKLREMVRQIENKIIVKEEINQDLHTTYAQLKNELTKESKLMHQQFIFLNNIALENITPKQILKTYGFLNLLNAKYNDNLNELYLEKDKLLRNIEKSPHKLELFNELKNKNANKYLTELVKKQHTKNEVYTEKNQLVQVSDPIFRDPAPSIFSLGAHFYAPIKYIFNHRVSTFQFNLLTTWIITILLFILLYFDILKKLVEELGKTNKLFRSQDSYNYWKKVKKSIN